LNASSSILDVTAFPAISQPQKPGASIANKTQIAALLITGLPQSNRGTTYHIGEDSQPGKKNRPETKAFFKSRRFVSGFRCKAVVILFAIIGVV
jgi:hypothetical protein